ncbi:MAG: aliphatic sulfonate ABC transporter substrate-binding protein [Chlorobiaceae bacterium]|nr:aliphatic sulfonate ABC transporter substrate-binding protein [Chlorobiaceae bacterium]
MRRFINRSIICIGMVLGLILARNVWAEPLPTELRIDYADYNPLSLVIKKFGWLEEEFDAEHVRINWVFSSGSDFGLEHLKSDTLDIASSASLSSVWSKAHGNPIKAVYVFARPEWNAILVSRNSPIKSLKELRGKKIAVAWDTSPYFFLMRALGDVGMHRRDVKIIPMPHESGKAAMEINKVDAWAGVCPYVSISQMESGSRVIYRNILFHSYGFLTISDEFARKYPEAVSRVIKVYERARKWSLKYPDDFEMTYAAEAGMNLPLARVVLSRYEFSRPVFDRNDIRVLKIESPVLKEEKLIPKDTDLDKVIDDLIYPGFVMKQVGHDSDR